MQITLKVENLSVKLAEPPRQVLSSVCAHVKPGQILAVMGPSGSGKTTLLNALSGRTKSSGRILLNGVQLNKSLRRQICYVLQNDVFFSNLTLRQTLEYAAMLRLPDSVSREHKMRQVDEVIAALDLKSCQNTIIGDFMLRGLSGGEKKRCSIASELLSNPAVMMLDEPTSSLDSCTALSLIKLLKQYAIKEQKTIIITIHQPSSQIFYLFDKLLLLSRGEMMYFGSIQQVLPHMQRFNYTMQHISYNPADFLMEVSKSCDDKELQRLAHEAREYYFSIYRRSSLENNLSIGSGPNQHANAAKSHNQLQQHQFVAAPQEHPKYAHLSTSTPPNQTNLLYQNLQHHSSTQTTNSDSSALTTTTTTASATNNNNNSNSNHKHHHYHHNHHLSNSPAHDDINSSIHSSWSKIYIYDDHDDSYSFDDDHFGGDGAGQHRGASHNKWPSSFLTQLCALTSRNFIDGKARMLSKLNWVQTIGLALVAGAIWFQAKRTEETMSDIKGWMYFSTMYWMMFALFNAITSFPAECQVINKERLAGSYRLSSYYVAKMIGELPLAIALPSAFHLISYPLLGYHSFLTFIGLWGFAILNALAAQSVGMFIGFTFSNLELSITIAALYSTSTILFGGFYSNTLPAWLAWMRYLSIVYYGYLNMQMVEFGTGSPISCALKNSRYPSCISGAARAENMSSTNSNDSMFAGTQLPETQVLTQLFIPRDEILVGLDTINPDSTPNPIWFNSLCLFAFLVFFRLLGYCALRIYHKPA